MSMHLVGPWMSTTNTKKRKQNKTKRQLQADIDHNKWLKKMGVSNQRSVAQSGSVSGLGPEGRKFESYMAHHSFVARRGRLIRSLCWRLYVSSRTFTSVLLESDIVGG